MQSPSANPANTASPGNTWQPTAVPTEASSVAPTPTIPPSIDNDAYTDMPVNLEMTADCGLCGDDRLLEAPLFRLYADGLALFRAAGDDANVAPYRYVQLSEDVRDALLRYALDEGGLRKAKTEYPGNLDDAGSTTFAFTAFYIDETPDKTVRVSPVSPADAPLDVHGNPIEDREIRAQLALLGSTLRDFEGWLEARGLESQQFEPAGYTAALVVTSETGAHDWPWTDLTPADFAPSGSFGVSLTRLSPAQAALVSSTPGGGRLLSVATGQDSTAEIYVRPLLPGDDLPGAFGLRADTAAVTVDDGLRVRSLPEVSDRSEKFEPLLRAGEALYVVAGPVEGTGYRWFEVYAPRTRLAGWVALADKEGRPWIEPRPLHCTLGASDDEVVGLLGYDLMHLACFRERPLTGERLLAAVSDDGLRCPDVAPYWLAPDWLNFPLYCSYEFGQPQPDTGSFDLISAGILHPSIRDKARELLDAAADQKAGIIVDVTGQLDHPDARGCTTTGDEPPPPVLATLQCRSLFVITHIEPAN